MMTRSNLILFAVLVTSPLLIAAQRDAFADFRGQKFCANRFQQRNGGTCCANRLDECSVPIAGEWEEIWVFGFFRLKAELLCQAGTLCYCDEFCDQHVNPDCCPDYEPVCKGVMPNDPLPVERCYKDGVYIDYLDTVKINCNEWWEIFFNSLELLSIENLSHCNTVRYRQQQQMRSRIPTRVRDRRLSRRRSGHQWHQSRRITTRLESGQLQRVLRSQAQRRSPISIGHIWAASSSQTDDKNLAWLWWLSQAFQLAGRVDRRYFGNSWSRLVRVRTSKIVKLIEYQKLHQSFSLSTSI